MKKGAAFILLSVLFVAQVATSATIVSTVNLSRSYQGGGISFNYPQDWLAWDAAEFAQIRNSGMAQGIDLLVMLKTANGQSILQVGKKKNLLSFDAYLQEKKAYAASVSAKGEDIMGYHYVKYTIEPVKIPATRALKGYAERSDGSVGISYQFLANGAEFNLNFIYRNK